MFSPPSNLDEWKEKKDIQKRETKGADDSRSVEDIRKEKEKMIAKNKELRETVYSHNFEGAEKITRRDFMKVGGALAGLWAIGKYGNLEKALNVLAADKNEISVAHKTENIEETKEELEEIDLETAESEIDQIKEDEAQPLKFQLDRPIKFTVEDIAKAKNYWADRYLEGDLKKDFDEGLERMKPYAHQLKKIFKEKGVPEELVYISLPESFFDPKRISKKGAVGAFQLMSKTARSYHLEVNDKLDERLDISKSADAAAGILADNYRASGNWDMATSGYNSGKLWKYPKLHKDESLENYLEHNSSKADKIRRDIKYRPFLTRRVAKEDTLLKLANVYGLDPKHLKKFNKKKSDLLKKDEIIKIPLKDKQQRERVFNFEIADYKENFNYMSKVRGAIEAVKIKNS